MKASELWSYQPEKYFWSKRGELGYNGLKDDHRRRSYAKAGRHHKGMAADQIEIIKWQDAKLRKLPAKREKKNWGGEGFLICNEALAKTRHDACDDPDSRQRSDNKKRRDLDPYTLAIIKYLSGIAQSEIRPRPSRNSIENSTPLQMNLQLDSMTRSD